MTTTTDIATYRTHLQAGGKPETTIRLRTWQLGRIAATIPDLRRATTADLATYLVSHGWAPATIYSVRATLRDYYRLLVASGHIDRSPADTLPHIHLHPRRFPPAPDHVIAAADVDARTRLMIDLAAREGMRRAEIARVHVPRDLIEDLDGWSLIVHGKGGKDRLVPLHPDVASRLVQAPRGWLFPSPSGGHLTANYVGVLISEALPAGWTAHSLRRRFATRAFDGSHDLRAVQLLLGHADLSTTQRYIGTRPESLRAALAAAA